MRRALLLVLAAPLLLPALAAAWFYGYENWTGGAVWRQAEAALQAAGEPLTVDAMRPQPVPDARNMAAAPIFRELFTFYSPRRASVYELKLPPPARPPADADESALVALARRFDPEFDGDAPAAAHVVLEGLAPMEPLLNAIRLAAARPDSVWPEKSALGLEAPQTFLWPLKRTSEVLAARATAAVAGRQSASALADFELIARLAGRSNQPPMLAGCFAGQMMLGHALDIAGDGLAQRAWSDADLADIEAALGGFHPLDDFREGVRGERALFLTSPEALNARAEALFTFVDFRSRISEWLTSTLCRVVWALRPSGWVQRDRANYATLTQDWLGLVIHNGFIRPWALAEWSARIGAVRNDPMEFFRTPLTVLVLPTFANAARAAAYTQARLDFARIACAIERHRRATGHVPGELAELAPRWIDRIPRDVIGGGSYFYRATGPDDYTLYGRGWNARDDGGSSANTSPLLGPATADDWVWTAAR
ncbi:MAG: hypothetical protein PHC88_05330 [Terrimicrobiaceae bacterium]|nr:hypothetical protein [Terrimicrobiaceae bacterium]